MESETSGTTYVPPLDIDLLESSVPLISKPEITSTFDSDTD